MRCVLITGMCVLAVSFNGANAADPRTDPIDVAAQFRRHCTKAQFDAAATLSVQAAVSIPQHELVQQMIGDSASPRCWRAADGRREADRAAVLWVVHPRDRSQDRTVEVLGLVKAENEWEVDLTWPPEQESTQTAADQKLLKWAKQRKEAILSIVNAESLPCYSFSGVWSTHYRSTFVKLIFSSDGQVVMMTIQDGSHGTDTFDYHMDSDEIVIETRFGPWRLRRDSERQFTTGGVSYDYLIMKTPIPMKELFPSEELRFRPTHRMRGGTVFRPWRLFVTRGQLNESPESR